MGSRLTYHGSQPVNISWIAFICTAFANFRPKNSLVGLEPWYDLNFGLVLRRLTWVPRTTSVQLFFEHGCNQDVVQQCGPLVYAIVETSQRARPRESSSLQVQVVTVLETRQDVKDQLAKLQKK